MGLNELNDFANSQVRDSLKSSLWHASSVNPDAFAEKQSFGKRNNIPTSLVPEDKTKRSEIELSTAHATLPETHPKTAAFLSKYENAAVSHDDIGVLSKIEGMLGTAREYYNYLHTPTEAPTSFGDFFNRAFPESVSKTTVGLLEFPYQAIKSFTDPVIESMASSDPHAPQLRHRLDSAVRENVEGVAKFSGEPLGVYGLDKAKEKWTTDPVGSVLGVLPFLGKLAETAIASKLRVRSPEQFKEHVKAAAEGVENITMPVETFEAVMAKSKLPPNALLSDPANYHDAKGGGSVSVPVEDFAANLAEHVTPEDMRTMRVGLTDSVAEAEADDGTSALKSTAAPKIALRPAVRVTDSELPARQSTRTISETTDSGYPFKIYRNPTAAIIENVFGSNGASLRLGIDKATGDKYVWDGSAETHYGVSKKLGYEDHEGVSIEFNATPESIAEALKVEGGPAPKLLVGEVGQRHTDILHNAPEADRGFTLYGKKLLSREEASAWLRDRYPETYAKLPEEQKQSLHSEGLWDSQGIEVPGRDAEVNAKDAEVKAKDLPHGPGAMGTTQPVSNIRQLRKSIPEGVTAKPSIAAQAVSDSLDAITKMKDAASTAFNNMKDIGQKIWDWYKTRKPWTGFDSALGDYHTARTESSLEVTKFIREVLDRVQPRVQEAIVNWIEAEGDATVLSERAAKSKGRFAQGYVDAMHLDEDHIRLAENIRNYFDARLQQAQEAGVVNQGVENFVHRIWDRSSKLGKRVSSESSSGMFQGNPRLAKQRIFNSFFEGEQLDYVPKDKRIGYLVAAYDLSLNEAIATRAFAKSLKEGVGSDGRPLVVISGAGVPAAGHEYLVGKPGETGRSYSTKSEAEAAKKPGQTVTEVGKDSLLIKPKFMSDKTGDYRVINHRAFTGWKWAGTVEGKSVLLQGDFAVHPEIYKHLNNLLGKSAIREFELGGYRPGNFMMQALQELKSTVLVLSAFHQTTEAIHGAGHGAYKGTTIDLSNPVQASLVSHGLVASSHADMTLFSSGLQSSGLVAKAPVVGRYVAQYSNYLFGKYIPELKMTMAMQALERNRARYSSKLNDEQILKLTADQANAAFGEQNYAMLGRNKTLQDLFSVAAFAPDFLESRAKFVGQMLRPYGKEQRVAIVKIAVGAMITAQVTNQILNGEMDWSHPLSIKTGGAYYSFPSVPYDMYHALTDPRGFVYNRLSPSLLRPVIETLTATGGSRKNKDFGDKVKDWFISQSPIPAQDYLKGRDVKFVDEILKLVGIRAQKRK